MAKFQPVFFDIETTGLNPMAQKWWDNTEHDAQVICIGLGAIPGWRGRKVDIDKKVTVISSDSEYSLLKSAKHELMEFVEDAYDAPLSGPDGEGGDDAITPFFVGWNNRNFDHPYMGARFARNRIASYPFGHGWKRLDAMRAIKSKTGRFWSQDDWMNNIGVQHEDDITGADVPEMFSKGRIDVIRKHCYTDIEDLADIFIEDREDMMSHFFSHYDIPYGVNYGENIEL